MSNRTKLPSYRRHRASGQAVVTLSGRDIYLGPWGTKISRDEYDRSIGEWLAAGRSTPPHVESAGLTVAELVNAFRKSGVAPASQLDAYKAVWILMVRLYGRTPAADFGPLALEALRLKMIEAGWKRRTINDRVYILRRVFRWGVSRQFIGPDVLAALETIDGLRRGQTKAPESAPVQAVAIEHINSCLAYMPPMLAAMVQVHFYTGMRAKELCDMRTVDIDTTGEVWIYP